MEEGERKVKKKISISFIFILIAVMTATSVAPVLAKSFKVPDGVILSYCIGGVPTIEDTPVGKLKITAVDLVDSTAGSGDFIHIDLWWAFPDGSGIFMPLAVIGTNLDRMAFFETLWTGVPAMVNNFVVSDGELKVDRHGNRITASLNMDISCFVLMPAPHYLDKPAFTMELNKVGGSFHGVASTTLDFYSYASGYTIDWDIMGFNANGGLTCPGWSYDVEPMSNCYIRMHYITTCTPPAD